MDVHRVMMDIRTHNFLKRFEKRVMRGIHWEIPTFKSPMGNENYFEKIPCACVVLFIEESCVCKRVFRVELELGRRRLRWVLRNSGLGGITHGASTP